MKTNTNVFYVLVSCFVSVLDEYFNFLYVFWEIIFEAQGGGVER